MGHPKNFPVLGNRNLPTIPWDFAETFRAQAEKNHRQTLERLAERGGLSVDEMWLAFKGETLFPKREIDEEAAFVNLQFNVEQWKRRNEKAYASLTNEVERLKAENDRLKEFHALKDGIAEMDSMSREYCLGEISRLKKALDQAIYLGQIVITESGKAVESFHCYAPISDGNKELAEALKEQQ